MIFNLAYDWNYFSFSFILWRFVFQTKILGNKYWKYIFRFSIRFWLFLHRFVAVGISLPFKYFLHTASWLRKPSVKPSKGAVGVGGEGELIYFSHVWWRAGRRLNWEVSLFNNGPIHALQSQVTKIGRKTTSALGSQNTLLTRPGRNKIGQN